MHIFILQVLFWDIYALIRNHHGPLCVFSVIEPKGDISIPAGAALELNCTMTEYNTTLDSQWLYFNHKPDDQVQHVRVPREYTRILGPRKIGLVIPGVELKHSGWYFCLLNESSIGKAEDTSITQEICHRVRY